MHYAILIDGGFAKRKLGTQKVPATAEGFQKLVNKLRELPELATHQLHRIYYYDSLPYQQAQRKPLQGGKVEFANQPIAIRSKQLLEQLSRLPYIALRLGELTFNGWTVRPASFSNATSKEVQITHEDLKPQISQKGVDMRIGMDIAALTLKKQVQIVVLVTGDSDFVPAMKFARREGVQLFLVPLKHRIREPLYEHSDLILDVELPEINNAT